MQHSIICNSFTTADKVAQLLDANKIYDIQRSPVLPVSPSTSRGRFQTHLVLLKVPALHHLVLATRKQIWLPGTDGQTPHCADVPGQGQLEGARGQVPDLERENISSCDTAGR